MQKNGPRLVNPGGADDVGSESAWGLVANVVKERFVGEGGPEIRSGASQFRGGAKVYFHSAYWGMGGETVTVVGYQRASNQPILCSLESRHLEQWRAAVVYRPAILRLLADGEIVGPDAEQHAKELAASLGAVSQTAQYRFLPRSAGELAAIAASWSADMPPSPITRALDDATDGYVLFHQVTPVGLAIESDDALHHWVHAEHEPSIADALRRLRHRMAAEKQRASHSENRPPPAGTIDR